LQQVKTGDTVHVLSTGSLVRMRSLSMRTTAAGKNLVFDLTLVDIA
jgi:hypothetical protein